MPKFGKGDRVNVAFTVDRNLTAREEPGRLWVLQGHDGEKMRDWVFPEHMITLARRAPVDLATCELPVEVVFGNERCRLEWRGGGHGAAISLEDGGVRFLPIEEYRPADAPAPAAEAGEVERLRARVAALEAAARAVAQALIAPTKREGV